MEKHESWRFKSDRWCGPCGLAESFAVVFQHGNGPNKIVLKFPEPELLYHRAALDLPSCSAARIISDNVYVHPVIQTTSFDGERMIPLSVQKPRVHVADLDLPSRRHKERLAQPTLQSIRSGIILDAAMEQLTHCRQKLNNYLQGVYRDDPRSHLTWKIWPEGPDNQPTWHAIAYHEVEWGRGDGPSRGVAMEAAAKSVLIALGKLSLET